MQLDDKVTIDTPEGLELELQLAGLGSRFIAGTVDLIIQLLAITVLLLVTGALSGGGHLNAVAAVIGAFAIWFAYPVAFEVLARGRTPGKRLSHLRVVRDSGASVDLAASAIRNLLRVLDGLPLVYLPTTISIIATSRNQRPGDLAAGTLVIREAATPSRRQLAKAKRQRGPRPLETPRRELPAWDVSAVTPAELAAVRGFLERRASLEQKARSQLARRLAEGLAAKVAGGSPGGSPERFLETVAEIKMQR